MKLNDIMIANEDYILARYQNLLKKQNILTIEDLLYNFPTKYEDYRVSSIQDAKLDEVIFEVFEEEVNEALDAKVENTDFETFKEEVNNAINNKVEINVFNSYKEEVNNTFATKEEMNLALDDKVDKADGKGLSSNDYTNEEKEKLANISLVTKEQIDAAFVTAGFNI